MIDLSTYIDHRFSLVITLSGCGVASPALNHVDHRGTSEHPPLRPPWKEALHPEWGPAPTTSRILVVELSGGEGSVHIADSCIIWL